MKRACEISYSPSNDYCEFHTTLMKKLNNNRMKIKHILIFWSMTLAFMMPGCSDFLNTKIDTSMVERDLETNRGALWALATTCYQNITYDFEILDGNLFAAVSDEAQQTSSSGSVYYFNKGIINADVNPLSYLYKNYYEGIRAADNFYDMGVKKGKYLISLNRDTVRFVKQYHLDLRRLDYHLAESQIIKAYYYSELIKLYGEVAIVGDLSDNKNNVIKERVPYDKVVDYIVTLIDDNWNNLQDDWSNEEGFANFSGLFDKTAALALKARVLLYAASPLNNPSNDISKWKKAATAAHELITYKNYQLPENRDYRKLFIGNNPISSEEVIFAVRRPENNTMEIKNYPISTPGGHSGVTPSHNLVSAYEYIDTPDPDNPYANRDPRLNASIVVNDSWWNGRVIDQSHGATDDMRKSNTSKTGYYLKKFLTDDLNLIQNAKVQHQWIIYRYTEFFLNYAEAMNEAFGPDEMPSGYTMTAREALNKVRKSASTRLPLITTTDKNEFRNAVKHERRVELAFEGHRYWDLLRWKDAMDVLNKPITGVIVSKNDEGKYNYNVVDVADRVFLERNYHFPFTRNEIVKSNGILKQNEGY